MEFLLCDQLEWVRGWEWGTFHERYLLAFQSKVLLRGFPGFKLGPHLQVQGAKKKKTKEIDGALNETKIKVKHDGGAFKEMSQWKNNSGIKRIWKACKEC